MPRGLAADSFGVVAGEDKALGGGVDAEGVKQLRHNDAGRLIENALLRLDLDVEVLPSPGQVAQSRSSTRSIPGSLSDIGASKDDIPALAAAAMADNCAGTNPRKATHEDVIELHTAAF